MADPEDHKSRSKMINTVAELLSTKWVPMPYAAEMSVFCYRKGCESRDACSGFYGGYIHSASWDLNEGAKLTRK
jgi:hypothetical protein